MGYESALRAAGAEVHHFESFGSWQGDWWAKVTYKGETGWVKGSFGSCSYCDAFESEFGCFDDRCEVHRWSAVDYNCEACGEAQANYEMRLVAFGDSYLCGMMSQEQAIESASTDISWDMDAEAMVEFLQTH